ncbi:hypothetical protein MVEN_01325400 [Mycena venus]|uniref:Uncharacterized protein n=1 Tax=Mycena venus TaxID=2733690 RepID=A0A8H6Y020_9AGAR|nr:hypothetical protein MVEN_01325400 [Mycena venus]
MSLSPPSSPTPDHNTADTTQTQIASVSIPVPIRAPPTPPPNASPRTTPVSPTTIAAAPSESSPSPPPSHADSSITSSESTSAASVLVSPSLQSPPLPEIPSPLLGLPTSVSSPAWFPPFSSIASPFSPHEHSPLVPSSSSGTLVECLSPPSPQTKSSSPPPYKSTSSQLSPLVVKPTRELELERRARSSTRRCACRD